MNIPIQFGLPQVILFVVALVGLVLLISMITGIIIGEEIEQAEDASEDARVRGHGKYIRRRHVRAGRGVTGILLLLIAISLLWATFLVQSYLGLTGDIKVAVVRATPIANLQHLMSVEMILYDKPDLERNNKHSVIVLNGGDDNFFKTAQTQTWLSPFVEALYGNAVILPANGKTYEVLVSQTGLYALPLKQ